MIILSAISRNVRSEGFHWRRLDTDLEDYLKKFNLDINNLEFINCIRDPSIKICKEGIIKRGSIYSAGSSSKGYRIIGIKGKKYFMHRLVYESFHNIKLSTNQAIDHIDTNPENNNLENLRAVSQKGNMNNPITRSKISKSVLKYSLSGELLEKFESLSEAKKNLKISNSNYSLSECCNGLSYSYHGFLWCFSSNKEIIKDKIEHMIFKHEKATGKMCKVYANKSDAERENGLKRFNLRRLNYNSKKVPYIERNGYIYQFGKELKFTPTNNLTKQN